MATNQNRVSNSQKIETKRLEKLSRLGCSFATDYKYRDLSELDQAKRFVNYGFTVKEVLDFWKSVRIKRGLEI